jgi:hypothetical protein
MTCEKLTSRVTATHAPGCVIFDRIEDAPLAGSHPASVPQFVACRIRQHSLGLLRHSGNVCSQFSTLMACRSSTSDATSTWIQCYVIYDLIVVAPPPLLLPLAVPRWTNKATATAEYPQWSVLCLPTLACAWAAVSGKRGGGQPIPCDFGTSEVNRATWVYVEYVLAHWPQEDAGRAIKVAATTIKSQSLVRRLPTLGKGDAARCATDRVATSTMSKSLVRPFPILNKGVPLSSSLAVPTATTQATVVDGRDSQSGLSGRVARWSPQVTSYLAATKRLAVRWKNLPPESSAAHLGNFPRWIVNGGSHRTAGAEQCVRYRRYGITRQTVAARRATDWVATATMSHSIAQVGTRWRLLALVGQDAKANRPQHVRTWAKLREPPGWPAGHRYLEKVAIFPWPVGTVALLRTV